MEYWHPTRLGFLTKEKLVQFSFLHRHPEGSAKAEGELLAASFNSLQVFLGMLDCQKVDTVVILQLAMENHRYANVPSSNGKWLYDSPMEKNDNVP